VGSPFNGGVYNLKITRLDLPYLPEEMQERARRYFDSVRGTHQEAKEVMISVTENVYTNFMRMKNTVGPFGGRASCYDDRRRMEALHDRGMHSMMGMNANNYQLFRNSSSVTDIPEDLFDKSEQKDTDQEFVVRVRVQEEVKINVNKIEL